MKINKTCILLPALLLLGGCDPDPPKPPDGGTDAGVTSQLTAVSVTCVPTALTVGQTSQCSAKATDQEGKDFTVSGYTWTSSNEAVASVDATGKVTSLAKGNVTLTASATADGVTRQGQATVSVNEAEPSYTLHDNTVITGTETWSAAGNPHVVRGRVEVKSTGGTPSLTLEAGVEVRFEQNAELRITQGALRAVGREAAPIRLVSVQDPQPRGGWRGVVFDGKPGAAAAGSELAYVTLSGCGGGTAERACIFVKNQAAPVLNHVTVQDSASTGVDVADDGSAFGSGSNTLKVSGGQGPAVRIGANQADSLPKDSTFTGNTPNAVELLGNISRSLTWEKLSPSSYYLVNGALMVAGRPSATLTLDAGVEVHFGRDAGLFFGMYDPNGGEEPELFGELILDGSPTARVLLTAESKTPGYWRGVHLQELSSKATRLSHATIEYAGAGSGTARGNLNVLGGLRGEFVTPVINDLIVRNGSHTGVVLEDTQFSGESTQLSSYDNGGPAIGVAAHRAGALPPLGTISGNNPNMVEILGARVGRTQTWRNLGVPYLISKSILVGGTENPTLTLEPGTELRFVDQVGLAIGSARTGPAVLIAEGTVDRPIVFRPLSVPGGKGSWWGVHFWQAEGSKLDHVRISHAGASGTDELRGNGNIVVHREIGPFLTNSTIASSGVCGISVASGSIPGSTKVTTDFQLAEYKNTFTDNVGGPVCED
jgi:Bacterial Ig-like domain (group 2)